jgi:hypothetical protein
MNTFTAGTLVRVSSSLADVAGVLTDATLTCRMKEPDGMITTLTVTRDAAGKNHADFLTAKLGLHQYEFLATGAAQAAGLGQFLVTQAPW